MISKQNLEWISRTDITDGNFILHAYVKNEIGNIGHTSVSFSILSEEGESSSDSSNSDSNADPSPNFTVIIIIFLTGGVGGILAIILLIKKRNIK